MKNDSSPGLAAGDFAETLDILTRILADYAASHG